MPVEQIDIYFELLNDIPEANLRTAVLLAIQSQKDSWLPSIGLIRSHAADAAHGQLPDAAVAWEDVRRAIRTFGYLRKAEALATLTPIARHAVMSVGWDTLCDSENIAIQAAQFRMAYQSAAERETHFRKVSVEIRPQITCGQLVTEKRIESKPETRRLIEDAANRMAVKELPQ